MATSLAIFFSILFCAKILIGSAEDAASVSAPLGDVRNCPTTSPIFPDQPLYRMEVLPGGGFDALRSLDMGQVHAYNYSLCRVSNDGRYLLPDNVFLVPTLESKVQVFSELIDHWDDYTSTVSSSISAEASFQTIVSGKFSSEYTHVKSNMYNEESVTTRVQMRNALYTVKLQPDSELHPTFRSRLFEMAANIQSNNTDYARYLSELLVRQYGTHFVTSMDAGAVLSQVDNVKSSILKSSDSSKLSVKASASVNFLGKLSIGAGFDFSVSHNDTQEFVNNRTNSRIYSWGGPTYNTNMTAVEWTEGVPNALVAIDRTGDPLYYTITPATLPDLPESTVFQLANLVAAAIARYSNINTRRGCTNASSPQFDFQANVDDNSCNPPHTNYSFGGVYQTCTPTSQNFEDLCKSGPAPVWQANPLTGDTSCPPQYQAILLNSGQYKHTKSVRECEKKCTLHFFNCHSSCYETPKTSMVNYEAYWCVASGSVEQSSGLLFGGFYTLSIANPFSGSQSCPRYYMPLHLGKDAYICASSDYELAFATSVPFAGFQSCKVGNPLAATHPSLNDSSSWPHACPVGFSQHLLTVDSNCEINYCVMSGAFNKRQLLPPRLPPFQKRTQMNPNSTDTLVIFGNRGVIWYKNADGDWVKDTTDSATGKAFMEQFNKEFESNSNSGTSSSGHGLSRGTVAGISISVTILLCTIIAFLVFTGYSIKKKLRRRKVAKNDDDVYLKINDENHHPAPPQENA